MAAIVIDEICVSQKVNAKINQLHGLTSLDVEDVVANVIEARWAVNEDGVERVLLIGVTGGGQRVKVALYPTDQMGVWNLGTAFPVQ